MAHKVRVAITGSTGLLGSRIIELLKNDYTFLPLLQSQLDITNKMNVENRVSTLDFDVFLHLAAYTQVDKAETEKDRAYQINGEGTKNLFEAVQKKNKKFIYISTDFVFDGNKPPYDEKSIPNPQSVYARSKYEGEKIVGKDGMIVRISYPYRRQFELKKDFVRGIVSALQQNKELQMVTDSLITPTFIDDIALGLNHLIKNCSNNIFHLVGSTSLSPYDAGILIAKLFHLNPSNIKPIEYNEYFRGRAKRPQYSNIISVQNNFYKMRSFEEGIRHISNF